MFLIFTQIPPRRTLLGVTEEKITLHEAEGNDLTELRERLHVPLGGAVYIVPKEQVTKLNSRIINEVVDD